MSEGQDQLELNVKKHDSRTFNKLAIKHYLIVPVNTFLKEIYSYLSEIFLQ